MRPIAFALCLAALACSAVPASAEDELPPTSQFFDEYDANADGKVTSEEFRGSREIFKLLDKNGDGAVCPDELGLPADYRPRPRAKRPTAGGEAPAGGIDPRRGERMEQARKRLLAMDADKDGRVSKAEWTGPEEAFDRFDRNKDGFIDRQDAPQGGPADGRKGRDRKGGPGKKGGDGKKGGRDSATAEQMKERAKAHFTSLDKNGDGRLTTDEAPNPKLIEMADADKDGGVTLDEFLAVAQKRMRDRPGAGGSDAAGSDAAGRDAPGRDAPRKGGKDGDARRRGGRISAGMLRRWDANKDGKVGPDEFPGRDDLFARLDADKDGFLTEADVQAARDRRDAEPDAKPEGDTPTTPRSGNLIEQQDQDGDGKLNRAEFKGPSSTWRLLDRNGDGWITPDELR